MLESKPYYTQKELRSRVEHHSIPFTWLPGKVDILERRWQIKAIVELLDKTFHFSSSDWKRIYERNKNFRYCRTYKFLNLKPTVLSLEYKELVCRNWKITFFYLSSVMDQLNSCVHFVQISSFVIFNVRRCLDMILLLCKDFFDQNIIWILNENYSNFIIIDQYAGASKGD